MRKELQKREDERGKFSGKFVRSGFKSGYKGPVETILLKDIIDENKNYITDHLWFNYTKGFKDLGELNEGDTIEFEARSKAYLKGYMGWRDDVYDKPIKTDYKLSHPSKVKMKRRARKKKEETKKEE